jgi:hypothetical protein
MILNEDILKKHRQLFENSCVPSSVEMVLKLEGIYEADTFDIQNRYGNKPISGDYFDREIYRKGNKAIKFRKRIFIYLPSLFEAVKNELRNKRFVIVPLLTSIQGNYLMYHTHVIYDLTAQGEYKTFTKFYQNDAIVYVNDMEKRFTDNFNNMIGKLEKDRSGIDILFYEHLA